MTDKNKTIKGAGGGRQAPPTPYRAPDTLHSRSFATIQDLISEGEIEGFATASKENRTKGTAAYLEASKKDVFFGDTPVLNASADSTNPQVTDFNFKDVGFDTRFGTNPQTALPGIPAETRTPISVGVTVTTSAPVTRQISNTDVDAVIVTLTWPQIQVAEDDGDLRGDTVEYKIQVQYQSGGYADIIIPSNGGTVTGRTADAYTKDHRLTIDRTRIDAGTAFPLDIRVIRVTADSTTSDRINDFQVTSLQEVIDNNSTYNDSAYCAVRLDSKQFNSIPSRKYRIRGIKVRIPGAGASGSGTPTVDNATGRIIYPSGYIFNGVMAAAEYTNCPAMCLLDLLTSTRYGLGDHIQESNLDLFSFVAASKYSNELVSDLLGGQEARFSCNVNIQSPQEAFSVINNLSGVMRCMPIWSAGSINISQDKETPASYLFNLANVGVGGFSYSGSSLKQRHTVISVAYFNMDSTEIDFEVVEDSVAIGKLGSIVKQIRAYACTSRGQAARLGRAVLFAEQNESETVSFTTSIDSGVVVRPGSVIEVNDPVRAGARRGGRVTAATTTTITIDAEAQTTLPSINDSPTVSVILSDGTVEVGTISNISGAVITVNSVSKINSQGETVTQSTFTSAPNVNSPYLISSTTLQTQLFRVIQVEEQDDINYVVTGLSYVEGKYNFINDPNVTLPTRNISLLNELPLAPVGLSVDEKIVVINNMARSKLIISWQAVSGVTQYQVNYKYEDTNFVSQVVFSNDFELLDSKRGTYTIEVFSYNSASFLSANAAQITFTASGKTVIPEDVSGLSIEPVNEQFVRLRFNQATAVDVLHGGRVIVRHTDQTGGSATFASAQDIIQAVPGNATEAIVPALDGTYLLKFEDDGKRLSANAAAIESSLVEILDSILIKFDREDNDSPPFNNTTTSLFNNTQYDSTKGGLNLISTAITSPATKATGTYDFIDTLDLGGTFSLVLKRHFQGAGYYPSALWDDRVGLVDSFPDWDGDAADSANAKLAVRTSTDMSTYTGFNQFSNGTFKGRGFQFRVTLESGDAAQNIVLQQLGYRAEMPSRTERSYVSGATTSISPIDSGTSSSGVDVIFGSPFFVGTSALGGVNFYKPSVAITIMGQNSGDYATIKTDSNGDFLNAAGTIVTGTGFNVSIKDVNNNPINKKFTFQAVGFGKGG